MVARPYTNHVRSFLFPTTRQELALVHLTSRLKAADLDVILIW